MQESLNGSKYNAENVIKNKTIVDIKDITSHHPYGQDRVISIIDLDGFIINGNVLETEAIQKISENSEAVIINSARILLRGELADKKNITMFPFLSESFGNHLKDIVTRANDRCDFCINTGFGKISKCVTGKDDSLFSFVFNSLNQGKKVVVGGSSFFDRNRVKKIIKTARENRIGLDNMFFFDTGKMII